VKYMGSKRWMLSNGLGHVLTDVAPTGERFVDLFSGSAAVASFVAENVETSVVAADLQLYSTVLAEAVISRTSPVSRKVVDSWISRAMTAVTGKSGWVEDRWRTRKVSKTAVLQMRQYSAKSPGLIAPLYGGYYFSPRQAAALDALHEQLPRPKAQRSLCLAALVGTATRCSASPGHTAQPFGPTKTALPFIQTAWAHDPFEVAKEIAFGLADRVALVAGRGVVSDALEFARTSLTANDVVFLDPPYSAAQYSRFYHVLETIARGSCGPVSGVGRYPSRDERPTSLFSQKAMASIAMADLLEAIGTQGCTAVLTFPQHGCSNGVTGEALITLARTWFEVDVLPVPMRYSTLGGNNSSRAARRKSVELVMTMTKRKTRRAIRSTRREP
jgi:adenine-specific DNA-methyltransferase